MIRIFIAIIVVSCLGSCSVANKYLYEMQPDGLFRLTLPGLFWCHNNRESLLDKINKSGFRFVKALEKEELYNVSRYAGRYFYKGAEVYSNADERASIIVINDWRVSRVFVSPIDWCSFVLYEKYIVN